MLQWYILYITGDTACSQSPRHLESEHGGSCCNDTRHYSTGDTVCSPSPCHPGSEQGGLCCNDNDMYWTTHAHPLPVIWGPSMVVHAAMLHIVHYKRHCMLTAFLSSAARAWWFMMQWYILYFRWDTACSPHSCPPGSEHSGSCYNDTYSIVHYRRHSMLTKSPSSRLRHGGSWCILQ